MSSYAKVTVIGLLLLALAGVLYLKKREAPSPIVNTPVATQSPVETPAKLPRLLELGADRCVPCKAMQPVLAELRTDYSGRLTVSFIDVWKEPAEGKKYEIQSIPTQIFFDASGREVFRHQGFFSKQQILAKFAELGINL